MNFYKNTIYRRNFKTYVTLLFFVFVILGAIVFYIIFNKSISRFKEMSWESFQEIESELNADIERINNYVLGIYSNPSLEKDFGYFFGSNAEKYIMSRINEPPFKNTSDSFLQNIRSFIKENNYFINLVALKTDKQANIIHFNNNGSTSTDFLRPLEEVEHIRGDISQGYLYSVSLAYSRSFSHESGEIDFLIDREVIFSSLKDKGIRAVVKSMKGSIEFQSQDYSKILSKIENSNKKHGKESIGFFNDIYYFVNTSESYGYELITMICTKDMLRENQWSFVILAITLGTAYTAVVFMIGIRMSHEAKRLNRIINAIQKAKNGDFSIIKTENNLDEYTVIGQEFNEMSKKLERYIRTEYMLQLKQKETEKVALQNQINPHFLYNTLEIIRSFALTGSNEIVAEAVYNLGSIYRDLVKGDSIVEFKKEISHLNKYLRLMELKYSGRFFYQVDIDDELLNIKTVKFWIQPIVENFFTHGYDNKSDFNLIVINISSKTDNILIEVINNGSFISEERLNELNASFESELTTFENERIGLINVLQRLKLFYDNGVSMSIRNNDDAGITVTVEIEKAAVQAFDGKMLEEKKNEQYL